MKSVTVVIPTRNRPEHVRRLLHELSRQSRSPDEVIVVDASDDKSYRDGVLVPAVFPLRWLDSEPHVCVQRNLGIQHASSGWIFLCDDDIGLPENYIEEVEHLVDANPDCGVACGLLMQKDDRGWRYDYPVKSAFGLIWAYIFQLPLWGPISSGNPKWLKEYFARKGNHLSKAGWPVLTDFHEPFFTTPYYSLGANIVRRDWLLQSPFDETLDPHGAGDNYGVIAGFPARSLIYVTHHTKAMHHRAEENRLERTAASLLRTRALYQFLRSNNRFPASMRRWLRFSLIGRALSVAIKGEWKLAVRTAALVLYMPTHPKRKVTIR